MRKAKSPLGFTLIEMMIAMFIMGILTTVVSRAIQTSVVNKKKMTLKVASQAAMYDTIRIVKRDVEKAFHYQDVFYQIEKNSITELNKEMGRSQPGQAQGQAQSAQGQIPIPQAPVAFTQFVGGSKEMHFTSLNNFRTRYNAPESDQMEVGYFVESCESRKKGESTKCLYRRSTPYIDDDVEKGGRKMVVVENVVKFALEYRSNEENAEWIDEWKSNNRGRADQQNKFPNLVKMTLELFDENDEDSKRQEETVVFQIHFPNNQVYFVPDGQNATTPPSR